MKKISTTALSKELGKSSQELFEKLVECKFIYRENNSWNLTFKGKEAGGELVHNEKYGKFIVWPEDLDPFNIDDGKNLKLINATKLGKEFDISSRRINMILAELGWIEKGIKGWVVTKFGKKNGGVQFVHDSGGTYVMWPQTILQNKALITSITEGNGDFLVEETKQKNHQLEKKTNEDFRTKYHPPFRAKDGHFVRSRAEVIIDNSLYEYGLAHAYERKLPVDEDVLSDFYIPSKNGTKAVYIEYWGLEKDQKYMERKESKKEIYKKHDLNLIELENEHIENLDDHLPRLLLKFNIKVE